MEWSQKPQGLKDLTRKQHQEARNNIVPLDWLLDKWPAGAVLLTSNPQGLGKPIRFFQRIGEGDPAYYGHAAICLKEKGKIIESVLKIQVSDISKYVDQQVLIFQHNEMDPASFLSGYMDVRDNLGAVYPAHRLLIHGFEATYKWMIRKLTLGRYKPRLSFTQWLPLDWPVCSELAAQFILGTGLWYPLPRRGILRRRTWKGINPDHLHDMYLKYGDSVLKYYERCEKVFTKVCEGTLFSTGSVVDIDDVIANLGLSAE